METQKELTLVEFADEVRRELTVIMSRCAFERSREAGMLAAVLCAKATGIVQGAAMAEEVASGDYDLVQIRKSSYDGG